MDYAHGKDYNSIGFGGFLNFSFPASESDYLTVEGGVQYFNSSDDEELALIPVLAGYRYTLDRSGSGFYVEPFAGYAFGGSTIGSYNSNGAWEGGNVKVAGPAGGLGIGYLLDIGNIPFNLGLRFQHNFGNYGTNIIAFRISHSFGFRKRNEY
ncbi:MAG: autotransporter domain-containing protein [Ginsengibacter sp.]